MLDGRPLFPTPLPTSNLLLWTSNVIKHAWLSLQRNSFAVELSNWMLLHLSIGNVNSVNDSGDLACHRFWHLKDTSLCPHSVFVFCVDLRTNSDYFPIQH